MRMNRDDWIILAGLAATLAILAALILVGNANGTTALCSTDQDCASKGYQNAYGVTPDKLREYSDRYHVDTVSDRDPVAECLILAGYSGLPDDGQETIYAGRDAIERCAADY